MLKQNAKRMLSGSLRRKYACECILSNGAPVGQVARQYETSRHGQTQKCLIFYKELHVLE